MTWITDYRFWMHTPLGVIAPLLALTHPDYGWVFCISFLAANLAYQIVQGGTPHRDIQGIIGGIPIGCLILWLIQM